MRTVETKIYTLDELAPDARQVAIENQINFLHRDEFLSEDIQYIMINDAELHYNLNLEGMKLEFSLNNCQGDGVAFYGEIESSDLLSMMRHANKNGSEIFEELHIEILERFPEISLNISSNSYGYHYSHCNTMSISIDYENIDLQGYQILELLGNTMEQFESDLACHIREISKHLENCGYQAIENYTSEESAIEHIEANEYEFYSNGEIA